MNYDATVPEQLTDQGLEPTALDVPDEGLPLPRIRNVSGTKADPGTSAMIPQITHPQVSPVVPDGSVIGGSLEGGDEVLPGPDSFLVLQEWRTWLEASFAPNTARGYWTTAMRFFREVPKAIGAVEEDDVARFLSRYAAGTSARRTYYQALKNLYEFAERRGYVHHNPVSGIRAPVPFQKEPRALTPEEVERLIDHAGSGMRPLAIALLYYTGCRIAELVDLRWGDVQGGMLYIRGTKSQKERALPIGPHLAEVLDALKDFRERNDDRLIPRTKATVWAWLRDAGRAAGIPGVHPHLLRSTFATVMLKRGAKPHTVRQLLGHENIRTTMRYLAVTEEDREEAINLL